jgi:hypothetical protein
MRTTNLVLLAMYCVLAACCGDAAEGAMGIQGFSGPAGKNGRDGADGADGRPGKDGAEGPPGERGAMGLQGAPGRDAVADELYRPLEWFGCVRLLDLIASNGPGADGINETSLTYEMLRYSNGDVETSCTSGLGSAISASDHGHYPAVTMGARTGGCIASGTDYPQTTNDLIAGLWEYGMSPQPHATYRDAAGHWLDGTTFTFVANDCHAYVADDKGIWQDASLNDVL